jgi:signal peptidase I
MSERSNCIDGANPENHRQYFRRTGPFAGNYDRIFPGPIQIMGGQPKLAGHHMYIVLSGSMEPTFNARSMVFVKPVSPESIQKGDIITFTGAGGSKALTTHRVVGIERDANGKLQFTTKGDANQVVDPNPVPRKG